MCSDTQSEAQSLYGGEWGKTVVPESGEGLSLYGKRMQYQLVRINRECC